MEDDKKRGKNFSESEKSLIIDLVLPHRHIIENIKTDGATNKEKDTVWNEIADIYNCQQVTGMRSIRQLKSAYDVLKRKARKDKSDNRVETYKTGGGCNLATLSGTTEKLIGILGDRLEPLHNLVDCDSDYPGNNQLSNTKQADQYIIETIHEEDLSDDLVDTYYDTDLVEKPLANKRSQEVHLTPRNKIIKTSDNQFVNHGAGTSNPVTVTDNQYVNIKKHGSTKKVYEGLNRLTSKHLNLIEDKEKHKDNLNSIALKKSKLQLEIVEMEHNIMVLKQESEKEKCASELKQNQFKEQILESELKQNKMKEAILSKQLINNL